MRRIPTTTIALAALALALGACGGDDDTGGEPAGESDASQQAGGSGGGGGGGGGTLVLGDETIALDSARCFLEEQDAAAGGGKILFVAQGFGTDANGDEVILDVSRYDEDSMFTGDDVIVDVGDPFSDTAVNYRGGGDIGTVSVDGSRLSADGLTFVHGDDLSEHPGSFEINC